MPKKNTICVFFSVIALLSLSGCETTSSISAKCSFTEEEVSIFKQKAEAGDAEAQLQMGAWFTSYCQGHDTSDSEGAKWYQRNLSMETRHHLSEFSV
jgi:hypothetical protein